MEEEIAVGDHACFRHGKSFYFKCKNCGITLVKYAGFTIKDPGYFISHETLRELRDLNIKREYITCKEAIMLQALE